MVRLALVNLVLALFAALVLLVVLLLLLHLLLRGLTFSGGLITSFLLVLLAFIFSSLLALALLLLVLGSFLFLRFLCSLAFLLRRLSSRAGSEDL